MAPGLAFPTNTTCTATAAKSRLRFLQGSTAAGNTTTVNVTTVSVCPVPTTLCATDPNLNSLSYQGWYDLFTNNLKTVALFNTNILVPNAPLYASAPFVTVTDTVVPDLSKFTVSVGSSAAAGTALWTASFTTAVNCRWLVQPSTTAAPTFSSVWTCSDVSWCGSQRLNSVAASAGTSTTTLKAFTPGTTYAIYYACYNDIPGAQKASIVQNSGTFAIAALPVSVSSVVVTPTIGSNFITASLSVLALFIALLF